MTELLDVQAAAKHLGVSAGTIYRMTSERRVRFYRIGRRCLFRAEDLDEWIETKAVEPEAKR